MNSIKVLTVIVITFCSILTAFGQNGLKDGNYFLLLKDKEKISLNTFENNEIKENSVYTISKKSIFATDQKKRVAILNTAKNIITLYEFETSKEIKLLIPYDIKPKCILLTENNLFVGGKMGKEMLVQYHIQSGKWCQLEIPEEVSLLGKAVDDLVINDSLLIAIDNMIIPKYILFYHLNSTGKLIFSHFKSLKTNGAYEDIYQGRITNKYLGLISKTYSGWTGCYEHITIYDDLNFTRSFAVSVKVNQEECVFNDFLLVENKLFIANREKGLGIFEIEDSYFNVSKDKYDDFNVRVSEDKVNYKQYKNEEIIQLMIIPSESKIILAIRNVWDEIRYEIMDV